MRVKVSTFPQDGDEAVDCLPPPCAHAETQAEALLDGSAMVRCTACRRIVRVTAPEVLRP